MVGMAILVVLLALLLVFAWSRKKEHPHQPEPPLHAALELGGVLEVPSDHSGTTVIAIFPRATVSIASPSSGE